MSDPQKTEKKSVVNSMQQRALDLIEAGHDVFITGAAGTGKSWVIQEYQRLHPEKKIMLCAPTGMAAFNIGGLTLHSALQISKHGVFDRGENGDAEWYGAHPISMIIIDEVSMCRLDLFEYCIRTIQSACEKIQIVCVGDFFQLPPVISADDVKKYKDIWGERKFAFESDLWRFETVVLDEVVRTEDVMYIDKLNKIRIGDKDAISFFNKKCITKPKPGIITICGRNRDADWINKRRILQLMEEPREFHRYKAVVSMEHGKDRDIRNLDFIKSGYVDEVLVLCVGMKVMTIVNYRDRTNKEYLEYINGEIGLIVEIKDEYIRIKTSTREKKIYPYTWFLKGSNGEELGSFTQLPLREAEAISIHKSQGQTYEEVNVDPSIFEEGHLYVALSRCKTLKGLHLLHKIDCEKLQVSETVKKFYEGL